MDFTILIPIALGWVGGLIINYASDVLPRTRRFTQPACANCQNHFSWADYLTLHACRSCGFMRSLRTWLVQILTTASFAYFWLFPSRLLGTPLDMIVLTYFGVIVVIDLEHRLILHPTSLFGAILGLITGTYIYSKSSGPLLGGGMSLLGGLFGFGVMFLFYQLGSVVARYRARKLQAAGHADDGEEALGGGDVYLAGVLGLTLGWPLILYGLMYGILIGGVVAVLTVIGPVIGRRLADGALMTFIPYGPSLIVGSLYALFFL